MFFHHGNRARRENALNSVDVLFLIAKQAFGVATSIVYDDDMHIRVLYTTLLRFCNKYCIPSKLSKGEPGYSNGIPYEQNQSSVRHTSCILKAEGYITAPCIDITANDIYPFNFSFRIIIVYLTELLKSG